MNPQQLIQRWSAQSPEQMLTRASEHLPFWVSLVLVIAIGYEAARLLWLLVPASAPGEWIPPPVSATAQRQNTDKKSTDYSVIVNAHIFGQPGPATANGGADAKDAPATNLNLQLRGAIAAEDSKYAHAIIADGTGNEKVYFLKDTVPGGATVQSVQPDRVILNRGGILEALLLPREAQAADAAAPNPVPQARRGAAPSMQDVLTQNANTITEVIRPQPYMPNGELKGYRVYPGRNREQFVALGLQPGDLVTEINGMTLNNPAQAMEIFRALADTTQAQLAIERDGKSQTLTLDTSQLAASGGAVK